MADTVTLDHSPANRELALDRLMRAPRAAIWRAWTEPELITRWSRRCPGRRPRRRSTCGSAGPAVS